jgi:PTH1 family peptidyl-tRNA hydrolase
VKIGVGKKPTPEYDLADWVLGKMPKDASDATDARLEDIRDAVRFIAEGKIDEAMQRYSK